MRIGVVLDGTAVSRFIADNDVAIGELIGEVADEQAFVAVPVSAVALASAEVRSATQHSLLELLTRNHRNVVVLPMAAEEGVAVGDCAVRGDTDIGLAQAIIEAERYGAQLVTDRGEMVRAVFGELHGVIDI